MVIVCFSPDAAMSAPPPERMESSTDAVPAWRLLVSAAVVVAWPTAVRLYTDADAPSEPWVRRTAEPFGASLVASTVRTSVPDLAGATARAAPCLSPPEADRTRF